MQKNLTDSIVNDIISTVALQEIEKHITPQNNIDLTGITLGRPGSAKSLSELTINTAQISSINGFHPLDTTLVIPADKDTTSSALKHQQSVLQPVK